MVILNKLVVVVVVYLPCEQWFLWARRYAMQGEKRSVASGLEKPLLAG